MEYPNYYFEEPTQDNGKNGSGKKRGAGGYIITSVVSMLVGALLATIFMPASAGMSGQDPAGATPSPGLGAFFFPQTTPRPDEPSSTPVMPSQPDVPDGYDAPTMTPEVPTGVMPALDGEAPMISDAANPIPDIVEQVSPGVVGIINYSFLPQLNDYAEQSSGSGFVISSEGYILTNAHVVNDAAKLGVTFSDGTEIEASLIGYDNTTDLAVIRVDRAGLHALKLGVSANIRVGEFVIAIGDPTGRELAGSTTFGIVSAAERTITIDGQTNTYLQVDAAVNPGNSGGPLINMNGEAIGIVSAKTVTASYDEYGNAIGAEGLGFALPIDEAMKIVSELITNGNIERAGIGISVINWTEAYATQYSTVKGVLVYSVTKNGPGDKAGLKNNDIIIEVDGEVVPEQSAFVELVRSKRVGDSMIFKVWRAGEYIEMTLILGDLNEIGTELVDGTADFDFFN